MRNVHIYGHGMPANGKHALNEIPDYAEIWVYNPANEPALLPAEELDRHVEDVDGALAMLRDAVGLIEARLGTDVGSTHDKVISAMPVAIVLHYPAPDFLSREEAQDLVQQIARAGLAVNVHIILVTPTRRPWRNTLENWGWVGHLFKQIGTEAGTSLDPQLVDGNAPFGPVKKDTGWRAAPDCGRCNDTGRFRETSCDAQHRQRTIEAHCTCKKGRRMSDLWYADKHGLYHPDMPEPSEP